MDTLPNLTSGLISYWAMEDAAGASRVDLIGGNTLTDVNTVAVASGTVLNAAGFTRASSQYLSILSNASLQTGDIDFTHAFWVYLTSKPAGIMYLVSKYNATSGNYEYITYWDNSADRFKAGVARATDSAQVATANTLGAPSTATWYFICSWHDSVADTINIEVNAGATDSTATGGALQAAGTAPFQMGGNTAVSVYLDGRLDEIGFWKRVLTRQERTWLYNNGRGRTWPFDGRLSPTMMGGGRNRHNRNMGMIT